MDGDFGLFFWSVEILFGVVMLWRCVFFIKIWGLVKGVVCVVEVEFDVFWFVRVWYILGELFCGLFLWFWKVKMIFLVFL